MGNPQSLWLTGHVSGTLLSEGWISHSAFSHSHFTLNWFVSLDCSVYFFVCLDCSVSLGVTITLLPNYVLNKLLDKRKIRISHVCLHLVESYPIRTFSWGEKNKRSYFSKLCPISHYFCYVSKKTKQLIAEALVIAFYQKILPAQNSYLKLWVT